MQNLREGVLRINETFDGTLSKKFKESFTEKKLNVLFKALKSQRFKPTPLKVVTISKSNGGTHFFGVASQEDKVVQAAILIQMEHILEKIFLNCSYGGRSNKNCHHALKNIKTKWENVSWIINIDLQKYFDTVNYNLLFKMLEEYCDQATIELLKKFLKCGYIYLYNNPETFEKLDINILQGSLISPILSNFYFHRLDCFVVEQLFPLWNWGFKEKFTVTHLNSKNIIEKNNLSTLVTKDNLREAFDKYYFTEITKQRVFFFSDSKDMSFRRMYYVRYFDDFIIGFIGTKAEAVAIKRSVEAFLVKKLLLNSDVIKSYISHSSDKGIKYLGFYIRYTFNKKVGNKIENCQYQQISSNRAQLRIPTELILRRAADCGFGKIQKSGCIRPTSCRKLNYLEDTLILKKFSIIIRSLMKFYSPANKLSDLWQIVAFYRKSCALTLADKHKLKTAAAVFKKYGHQLKITDPKKNKEVNLFYPVSLRTTGNFKLSNFDLSLSYKIFDFIL